MTRIARFHGRFHGTEASRAEELERQLQDLGEVHGHRSRLEEEVLQQRTMASHHGMYIHVKRCKKPLKVHQTSWNHIE